MLRDPGVIGSDVIGHEVQDESHAPCCELLSGSCQSCRAAQSRINDVVPNAVGGTDDIGRRPIGHGPGERLLQGIDLEGQLKAQRAALPHPHQPDSIKAVLGQ